MAMVNVGKLIPQRPGGVPKEKVTFRRLPSCSEAVACTVCLRTNRALCFHVLVLLYLCHFPNKPVLF
jgi:hypothetical protein